MYILPFMWYTVNMKRIKVYPIQDYYVAFLATRGIKVVEDNEDILHYFGKSRRKLKKMGEKSGLTIIHTPVKFDETKANFNYAIDYVKKDSDIYRNNTIRTNAPDLIKLYYRRLAIQKNISVYEPKEKVEKKPEVVTCPKCNKPRRPHFECTYCGHYGPKPVKKESKK